MKRFITIAAMMLVAKVTLADGSSGVRNINMLATTDTGEVWVYPVGGSWDNPDLCTNSSAFLIGPWVAEYKVKVATLLSAQAQDKQLAATFSGCDAYGYPRPLHFYVF